MDSAAIGQAGTAQLGTYPLYGNEATETAQEVAANFSTLQSIAAFCRANGIVVQVDAGLNDGAVYSDGSNQLVDQWAPVAAAAGLPIASVEDVNELGIVTGTTPAMFANEAKIEVNAVQTLIGDYATSSYQMTVGNLAVGDMEAGNAASVPEIAEWWNAYDVAAQSAGLSGFSFVSAEMGWDAPWLSVEAGSSWEQYLAAIASLTASNNMALNVVVQGMETDITGSSFVLQQEQHAAQLASFAASDGINIAGILVRTWQPLPVGVNLIDVPNSMSNAAAEIAATYPLYAGGSITVMNSVAASVPGQAIVSTGSTTSLPTLSMQWSEADVDANHSLAVVIIDQTGTLRATQHGSGTVSNQAPNILILNGNSADLSVELSSLTLNETCSGPDTIDVETFGSSGQLSDNQISVLALSEGQSAGLIDTTSSQQGWTSSSAILNTGTVVSSGSIMTSETLQWNTTGALAGAVTTPTATQPAFVKINSVHEPLAEYGVEDVHAVVNGVTINAVADYFDATIDNRLSASGGFANNPSNQLQWASNTLKVDPFNPATELTSFVVKSTVNTFDPSSGKLEQSVDTLAPDPLTIVNFYGTAVVNTFSSAFNLGGSQSTVLNTGDNPAWQSGWGSQFGSATLTYDAAGGLVEQYLQGGSDDPSYSIDNVYDPTDGQLWEQFQTSPPPAGYTAPASGPLCITEFNTGDNPNWDYIDWGTSANADTEAISTYLITDDAEGAPSGAYAAEVASLYEALLGRISDPAGLECYTNFLLAGGSISSLRTSLANSTEGRGDICNLYQAVLGRTADPGGLAAWTQVLEATTSLSGVHAGLANSPEGQGDICNLYQAVLGRTADPGGLVAWTQALATTTPLSGIRTDLVSSTEGQGDICNLYQAVLGRTADPGGLAAWTQVVEATTSLSGVHASLANSPEGQGDISNLYQAVLGRTVDPGGLVAWTQALEATTSLSGVRADLANSPEGQGDICNLYQAVLGRTVDPGGLVVSTQALEATTSLSEVRVDLANSPEGQGDISNLYQAVLGRTADPGGLVAWTQALATTTPLSGIRADLANSTEAQGKVTSVLLTDGDIVTASSIQAGQAQLASGLSLSDLVADTPGRLMATPSVSGQVAKLCSEALPRWASSPDQPEPIRSSHTLTHRLCQALRWRMGIASI